LLLLAAPVLYLMAAVPSAAAESPDALYRKGRFAEAEKAYAQADMDNPKDLRARYNRGCAAYQNKDYQTAAAAFASVLRRSQDPDIRFNAAYNLGNAAYQQGDFKSASQHFKQALAANPSSEDARHNLELALRGLAKQKDQPDQQPQDQQQQDSGSQQNQSGSEKEKDDQNPSSKDPSSERSPEPEKQKEGDSAESKNKEESTADRKPENQSQANQQPAQGSRPDMAGELKARNGAPPEKADGQPPPMASATMDKQKAEALLDNIQENRARMLQLQTSRQQRQGVASGKDW
jgi:Ca-activated chloride channel family protein